MHSATMISAPDTSPPVYQHHPPSPSEHQATLLNVVNTTLGLVTSLVPKITADMVVL
jgi:hypothetical protein